MKWKMRKKRWVLPSYGFEFIQKLKEVEELKKKKKIFSTEWIADAIHKKDGVDWIVDLKFTKKWKGKWEKKDGFCRVVDLKCKRLAKKKRKKKKGLAKLWIWN